MTVYVYEDPAVIELVRAVREDVLWDGHEPLDSEVEERLQAAVDAIPIPEDEA